MSGIYLLDIFYNKIPILQFVLGGKPGICRTGHHSESGEGQSEVPVPRRALESLLSEGRMKKQINSPKESIYFLFLDHTKLSVINKEKGALVYLPYKDP